jgi:uncharacterized membrane protein YfcA
MNPMTMTLLCVAIGLLTGVVSALCGVGGGIIMVPAFVMLLKLQQKEAVATSLAAIILTSVAASVKNSGNNLVDWRIAMTTGIAAGVVAFMAAGWLKSMSNVTLTRVFGVLVIVMGVQMLWSTYKAPAKAPAPVVQAPPSTLDQPAPPPGDSR